MAKKLYWLEPAGQRSASWRGSQHHARAGACTIVIKEALKRAGVKPEQVDMVYMAA